MRDSHEGVLSEAAQNAGLPNIGIADLRDLEPVVRIHVCGLSSRVCRPNSATGLSTLHHSDLFEPFRCGRRFFTLRDWLESEVATPFVYIELCGLFARCCISGATCRYAINAPGSGPPDPRQ